MRFLLVAGMLLAIGGCAKEGASEEASILELGSEHPPGIRSGNADGAPITASVPALKLPATDRFGTSSRAVLNIGKRFVAEAQGILLPTSVLDYCRQFSTTLTQPEEVRGCLGLVDMHSYAPNLRVTVKDVEALKRHASSLDPLRRFALCTSAPALRVIQSFDEFDRCFPPNERPGLESDLAATAERARSEGGLGPAAFPYPDPLWTASQLGPEERVAFCAIPAVAEQLEGDDVYGCVEGRNTSATVTSAPSFDSPPQVNALAVLSNASQMRSQAERDALCNRTEVRTALTTEQQQECLDGVSPRNPPHAPLVDGDPGYRDEGH